MAEALSSGVDQGPSSRAPGGEFFALIATGDRSAAAAWLARELAPHALTRAARTLAAHAVRGRAEYDWVESVVHVSEPPWPLILAVDDALALNDHATERRAWLQSAAALLDERTTSQPGVRPAAPVAGLGEAGPGSPAFAEATAGRPTPAATRSGAQHDPPAARPGVWRRLVLVCLAQRDHEGTTRALQRHRELAEAWYTGTPSEAAALAEFVWVQVLAGDAAWRLGRDSAGAGAAYQRGLALLEPKAGSPEPGSAAAWLLGRSVTRLGDMCRAQGDLGGALAAYRRGLEVYQHGAVALPADAGWQRELARCHARLGDVMSDQHDAGGALLAYRQSLQLFERLLHHEPAGVAAERDLAGAHLKVGDALLALGDVAAALVAYRHGTAIRSLLVAARAGVGSAELQHDLWMAYGKLADAHERTGSPEAAHWWRQAFEVLAALKVAGNFNADTDAQFLHWFRHKAFPDCPVGVS